VKLSEEQLARFGQDGLLILPDLFSAAETALLRGRLPALFSENSPANIREKDSDEVRTAMGLHLRDAVFAKLVRHPRLVEANRFTCSR
jgi:ectoine hydroxylase